MPLMVTSSGNRLNVYEATPTFSPSQGSAAGLESDGWVWARVVRPARGASAAAEAARPTKPRRERGAIESIGLLLGARGSGRSGYRSDHRLDHTGAAMLMHPSSAPSGSRRRLIILPGARQARSAPR